MIIVQNNLACAEAHAMHVSNFWSSHYSFVLLLPFFVLLKKRHECCATADLRCHGDIKGDRHRPSRRRLAAALVNGPEGRRPGHGPGDLQVARLHGDFPRRGLPGLLRPLQVQSA